jgi:hypothetical protein
MRDYKKPGEKAKVKRQKLKGKKRSQDFKVRRPASGGRTTESLK